MEIRVRCDCGSVYSFNEEPENGRLRFPVKCTNCGPDGTLKANQFIARVAQGLPGLEEPHKTKTGGLLTFALGRPKGRPAADVEADDSVGSVLSSPTRMGLGIAACLLVGILGALGWHWLCVTTYFEFGFVAWGIGGLVGWSARKLVPDGSFALAGVAALCAALAICGGQFLTLKTFFDRAMQRAIPRAYDGAKEFAETALVQEDDESVRKFVVCYRQWRIPGAKPSPECTINTMVERQLAVMDQNLVGLAERNSRPSLSKLLNENSADAREVTPEEIASFRETDQPYLQAFVNGKPTRADFEARIREKLVNGISTHSMIVNSMTPYTFLWLFLGIGTAFKLAHNAGLKY